MRIEQKGSLDNILCAVYYCWDKNSPTSSVFPPPWYKDSTHDVPIEYLQHYKYIRYRSSSNTIKSKDFKEYNYKLFPDKGKYSDFDIMDLYGDEVYGLTLFNPLDNEKISLYGFPTIYSTSTLDGTHLVAGFFNTKTNNYGEIIYQFEVPENCYKVELYDKVLMTFSPITGTVEISEYTGNCILTYSSKTPDPVIVNVDYKDKSSALKVIHEPVVSIYFGPERNNNRNSSNMYYKNTPDSGRVSIDKSVKDYLSKYEEITSNKVVTLISKNGKLGTSEINIVHDSFTSAKDPMKNLNKVALRNDEWWSSVQSINQVGERESGLYDLTSGTLIGNREHKENDTPLLRYKKSIVKEINRFSRDHTYMKGDTATVQDKEYVSIIDNNRGNYPAISPYWIVNHDFEATFSRTINIKVDPEQSGIVNKKFINYEEGTFVSLIFTPNPGYEFGYDDGKFNPTGIGQIRLDGKVGSTVPEPLKNSSTDEWRYWIIEVSEGETYTITGRGGTISRLWAFADKDNKIISASEAQVDAKDLQLIAPANAKYLYINNSTVYNDNPSVIGKDRKNFIGELSSGTEKLVLGEDYTYSQTTVNGKITRNITIKSWEKLLKTNKLIIKTEARKKSLDVRIKLSDKYYYLLNSSSSSFARLLKKPDSNVYFDYSDVLLNGDELQAKSLSNLLEADAEGIKLNLSKFENEYYVVESVTATYTNPSGETEDAILDEIDPSSKTYIDNVISSKVVYTINLKKHEYKCKIYFDAELWEVEDPCPIAYYNEPLSFRFYPIDETKNWKNILKEVYLNKYKVGRIYNELNEVWSDGTKFLVEDPETGLITCTVPKTLDGTVNSGITFDEQDIKIFINDK